MSSAPGKIAFAGGTVDRAAHLREDGAADRLRGLDSSRVVLVGDGQTVAVTAGGGRLALVPVATVPGDAELTFLGLDPAAVALFAYDAGGGGGGVAVAAVAVAAVAVAAVAVAAVAAVAVAVAVAVIRTSSSRRCGGSPPGSNRRKRRSRPTRSRSSAGTASSAIAGAPVTSLWWRQPATVAAAPSAGWFSFRVPTRRSPCWCSPAIAAC